MVDRTEKVTSSKRTVVTPAVEKKYLTFETEVSTDNTVTLEDLSDILGAAVFKKSDGTSVTFTEATNIITITQAGLTDEPVVGFAYGT